MTLESNATPRLKCLSIQQPWAWLVCSGDKDIENRDWKTDFRGTIAIHASTKKTQVNTFLKRDKSKRVKSSDFEFGAIIGLADIESISVFGKEHEGKPHAYGTYCWKMTNARFLRNPIPMLGQLGLRHLSDELAANVLSQETIQVPHDSPIRTMLLDNMEAPPNPLEQYEYCIRYLKEKGTGAVKCKEISQLVSCMLELEPNNLFAHCARINLAADFEEVSLPDGHCKSFESAFVATYGNGSEDTEFRRVYEAWRECEPDTDEYRTANSLSYYPEIYYPILTSCLRYLYSEFLALGDAEKAMEYNNRRFALEADAPETLVDRGGIFLNGFSDSSSAIAPLRGAIKLLDHGKDADADVKIASYLEDDPEYDQELLARGLLLLTQALRQVGEIGEATIICVRLLKIDKANPAAYVEACQVAIQNDNPKLAKKYLKKALELNPEYEDALSLQSDFQGK